MPKLNLFSPVLALAGLLIASAPDCRATLMTVADVGVLAIGGTPVPCGAVPSTTHPPIFDIVSGQSGPHHSSSASFQCTPAGWVSLTGGDGMVATAKANSGIGPLGIGVSARVEGGNAGFIGSSFNSFQAAAYAFASWSNLVIPVGGTGNGFIQLNWFTTDLYGGVGGRATFEFNQNSDPFGLIPITFGLPYSLDLTATAPILDAFGAEGSGAISILDSVSLYNANGNLLPNGSLAITPEPTSILLLVTVIIGVTWLVRSKANRRRNVG
jgi:hypothetical protein